MYVASKISCVFTIYHFHVLLYNILDNIHIKENNMTDKLDKLEARLDAIMDTLEGFKNEIREIRSGGKIKTVEVDNNNQDDPEFMSLEPVEKTKIKDILKNFDFERVHSIMKMLDWKWAMVKHDDGIPSVDELKAEAKRLLIDAATEKTQIATGGFRAVYEADGARDDDPYIGLEFIAVECEGFVDEDYEDDEDKDPAPWTKGGASE